MAVLGEIPLNEMEVEELIARTTVLVVFPPCFTRTPCAPTPNVVEISLAVRLTCPVHVPPAHDTLPALKLLVKEAVVCPALTNSIVFEVANPPPDNVNVVAPALSKIELGAIVLRKNVCTLPAHRHPGTSDTYAGTQYPTASGAVPSI